MIEYKPRKIEKPKIENEKVAQAWDYIQRVGSPYDFCYLDQFLEDHTSSG